MLGKMFMDQRKKYSVGDIVETNGDKYKVIKNLGVAFKDKKGNFYRLEVEKVD